MRCSARMASGNAEKFRASPRSAWRNTISMAGASRTSTDPGELSYHVMRRG